MLASRRCEEGPLRPRGVLPAVRAPQPDLRPLPGSTGEGRRGWRRRGGGRAVGTAANAFGPVAAVIKIATGWFVSEYSDGTALLARCYDDSEPPAFFFLGRVVGRESGRYVVDAPSPTMIAMEIEGRYRIQESEADVDPGPKQAGRRRGKDTFVIPAQYARRRSSGKDTFVIPTESRVARATKASTPGSSPRAAINRLAIRKPAKKRAK